MSVNLCAQEGEEPRDVVIHFDVRFRHDNIVSLSRKDGVWIGSGNHDTNYNMFVPGTTFRIEFLIRENGGIIVYCQGKYHSNFLPKVSLEYAKFLVAWCDVEKVTHCYFLPGRTHLGGDSEQQESTDVVGHCVTPSPPAAEPRKSRRDRRRSPTRRAREPRIPQKRDIELEKCMSKVATTRASCYFYDALMGGGRSDAPQEYYRPDRRRTEEPMFRDIGDIPATGGSANQNDLDEDEHDCQKTAATADTSAIGKFASFFASRKPREQNVRSRGMQRRRHREGVTYE